MKPEDLRWLNHRLFENADEVMHPVLKVPCLIAKSHIGPTGVIRNGYSSIKVNNVPMGAHVVAFMVRYERLPSPGMQVCHLCDRKACRRPEHMVEGTPKENMRDAVERGRIARGARHGSKTHPESVPKGEKNRSAKMTEEKAAYIKWLLEHSEDWYSPEIQAHYPVVTAIAIAINVTVGSIRRIQDGSNWKDVNAQPPSELPFANGIVEDKCPPTSTGAGVLSPDDVRKIRVGYHENEGNSFRSYAQLMHRKYGVSVQTIYDILKRKTWKNVAPEIPAVVETGHGMADLTERQIQQIRATFAKYEEGKPLYGLLACLSRHFECSKSHVRHIIERLLWREVPDDLTAALTLEEIGYQNPAQIGENHALAVLTEAEVYEALTRMHSGETKTAVAKRFGVSPTVMCNIYYGKTWRYVWLRFHADNPGLPNGPDQGPPPSEGDQA